MNAGFGDWEPDDSFALGRADPESVARILFVVLADLADDPARPTFAEYVTALTRLLERLRREGAL